MPCAWDPHGRWFTANLSFLRVGSTLLMVYGESPFLSMGCTLVQLSYFFQVFKILEFDNYNLDIQIRVPKTSKFNSCNLDIQKFI